MKTANEKRKRKVAGDKDKPEEWPPKKSKDQVENDSDIVFLDAPDGLDESGNTGADANTVRTTLPTEYSAAVDVSCPVDNPSDGCEYRRTVVVATTTRDFAAYNITHHGKGINGIRDAKQIAITKMARFRLSWSSSIKLGMMLAPQNPWFRLTRMTGTTRIELCGGYGTGETSCPDDTRSAAA